MPCAITRCISAVKRAWPLGLVFLLSGIPFAPAQPRVVVWGINNFGETNVPPQLRAAVAIAAGYHHCLALQPDGRVIAWGDNNTGQTNVPPSVTNAMAISAGEFHSLALRSNGTVVAWGHNGLGQLNVPPSLSGVVAISAGRAHSLAMRSNGTVVAWGSSFNGETNVPPGLSNVVAVSAGDAHSLALRANGTVEAWGDNASMQLNTPLSLTNARAIAAGYHHNLAIRSNGTLVAWQQNLYGEAVVPPGLSNVMAISAGYFSSIVLQSNGSFMVLGAAFSEKTNPPPGLSNVIAISDGFDHVMALTNGIPDQFAFRMPIAGSNINLALSNIDATNEVDETGHSPLTFGGAISSIWLTWTAPFSGGAVLSATASFLFPVIAVYTGNTLSNLNPIVNNISGYNQSRVVFNAVAGTTYQIAIDNGTDANQGEISFNLQLAPPPANDAFANRTPILGSFLETSGSFIGATKELGEPTHADSIGDPDFGQTLWWTWTAPNNVGVTSIPVSLMADAVSFPPNIGVYTGNSVGSLGSVSPLNSYTNGMTRVTTFTATAGTTYHFALGGQHYDTTGNNLAVRYGNYRLRFNMRALVLGIANVTLTNDVSGDVSFGATAQVTNYGSAGSNPLRVRVAAISGVSVRGPDTGYVVNTNYTLYLTNLAPRLPGQGAVARVFGTLPAPEENQTQTEGIGYGAYAELQEQFGSNWHTIDQNVIAFGDWPTLGGFAGPGGGVIRLDPGLTGSPFIPLTNVSVVGPAIVLEGTTTPYTGVARYADGNNISFTDTIWTATRFSITNGLFTAGNATSNTPVVLTAKYSNSGFIFDATNNVTVSNLPPPRLAQPRVSGGLFTLQLQGVPNRKHAIDATTNLSPPVIWSPLITNAPGASGLLNFTNSIGTIPRRFYRGREVE